MTRFLTFAWKKWRHKRRNNRLWDPSSSPITRRILLLNLLAPLLLAGGLLYLDRYKEALIRSELTSLKTQAQMFAVALGEGAVSEGPLSFPELNREIATQMLKRLVEPAGVRARLYNYEGRLVLDSRLFTGNMPRVVEEELPQERGFFEAVLQGVYDSVSSLFPSDVEFPLYSESAHPSANDYPETIQALIGETSKAARTTSDGQLVLYAAVPVQRYRQVTGAILLSNNCENVARGLWEVRRTILELFVVSLVVTILLSLYLAGTIARPIHRLALAAEQVRRRRDRNLAIPDLSRRKDEIGELSAALRDMTEALWQRMDAIEAFAADVAHEIKNPLTSLRSAIETANVVHDPAQKQKLMAIVMDDIDRLNRLISDISDASRLDAELSRAEFDTLSLARLLQSVAEIYAATAVHGANTVRLEISADDALMVAGMEGRLVQVIRNLVANALSFNPPDEPIYLRGYRTDTGRVCFSVEDSGPGIPENKLDAIFERFYSERPPEEKFGIHSGLGLSISRQIIAAHHGRLYAENRYDDAGAICGARFIADLPPSKQASKQKSGSKIIREDDSAP